jgi:spiro-SPASM protein
MNNLLVLYAGNMSSQALEPLFNGKNALQMSAEQAAKFPGVAETVVFASSEGDYSCLTGVKIEKNNNWTKKSVLQKIAELQDGKTCVFFAFADCPFLDPALAGSMLERHTRYAAEYSYADGYAYGLAPEILSAGTAGILAHILGDDDGQVERDMLFSVIQKDINAFDIEAEISTVDLRSHRINLCADSKRDLMLLKNFYAANSEKIPAAADVERIAEEQSEILRTLPSFYPIQVCGGCTQKCAICPYPLFTDSVNRKDSMDNEKFTLLLEKIIDFSGDAVIDLSLWGELSLHPQKLKLIEEVLVRPELALIIETSGVGWKNEDLEKAADLAKNAGAAKRINPLPPLSWIISLDTNDPQKYSQLRGAGFAEASSCAKKLLSLFQHDCYVQAVRTKGSEEDTEKFYRYWKDNSPNGDKNIIIQKYDDFCDILEKKQSSDISPVIRQCCWHIMRDMPILIDGVVPLCRENLAAIKGDKNQILGNVFEDSLDTIWQNGAPYYRKQCKKSYMEICSACDEYYTYNF